MLSILGVRDSIRFTTRVKLLFDLKNSKKGRDMMLPLLDQFNQRRLVCERCAQGCPITAPSLMMVHSSYDITAEQLADAIDSANALEAMCVIMFDPKILVDKSGVIAEQDCIWRVSRDPETKKN